MSGGREAAAPVAASSTSEPPTRDTALIDGAPRSAAAVYGVVAVVGAAMFFWAGRDEWFHLDEWDYLANRSGGDLGSILRPHNEHWTTLPVLAYRLLFNAFGLQTYAPYLALAIATHVATATLLRAVMRRAGVAPWIATAAASLFVLFGTGDSNIVRGFQITFTGAIAFGLVQILLLQHKGDIDWHDGVGLLAGAAALMCSGVGVSMVMAAGITAFIARGWRVALVHTVPPFVLYLLWWQSEGRPSAPSQAQGLARRIEFIEAAFDETLAGLTKVPYLGVVLVAVVCVGLVLACRHPSRPEIRRRVAAPLGLAIAAVSFIAVVASSRVLFGPDFARAPRYVHVLAALVLPAVALAADAIARRWRWTAVPVVLLFVVPIPANVSVALDDTSAQRRPRSDRELTLALAARASRGDLPEWIRPDPTGAREVTVGWLAQEVRAGRVPAPEETSPALDAQVELRMTVQQIDEPAPFLGCAFLDSAITRELAVGDEIGIRGGRLELTNVVDGSPLGRSMAIEPLEGETLVVVGRPITVRIVRGDSGRPTQLCG